MKTIEDYLKELDQLEVPDVEPTRALAAAERVDMLLEISEEPEEGKL